MLLMFLFTVLATASGEERVVCDGVIFHHVYFGKQFLFGNWGRPYNLVLHRFSGTLFFSHTIQNGTLVDFGIAACHVEKRACHEVKGVAGGYAIAYDSGNDDIYFGGHDGIYKYNFLTKSADFFAEEGKSIWSIFVRKNFYYIEYPSQRLYVYQEDTFLPVNEAKDIEVDQFFIAKHGDIYFSNKTALYKIERSTKSPVVLDDEIVVRQIVEDGYGDAYFLANDGIYLEDKPYLRVKKVANIDQAFGLTFDEQDHIIFSDANAIYRLFPTNHSTVCYDALMAPTEQEDDGRRIQKKKKEARKVIKALLLS